MDWSGWAVTGLVAGTIVTAAMMLVGIALDDVIAARTRKRARSC